jgi:hypothetical protein
MQDDTYVNSEHFGTGLFSKTADRGLPSRARAVIAFWIFP